METLEIEAKYKHYLEEEGDWSNQLREAHVQYSAIAASVPSCEEASPVAAAGRELAGHRYVDPDILASCLRDLAGRLALAAPAVRALLEDCDPAWQSLPPEVAGRLAIAVHEVAAAGKSLEDAQALVSEVLALEEAKRTTEDDRAHAREEERLREATLLAASGGDSAQLQRLLATRPDLAAAAKRSLFPLDHRTELKGHIHGSHSALTLACEKGSEACVALLLENRADVEHPVAYKNRRPSMSWEYRALHLAARAGSVGCLEALLLHGADVSAIAEDWYDNAATDTMGATALHLAAGFKGDEAWHMLAALLRNPRAASLVNAGNSRGRTPLHMACIAEAARTLMQARACASRVDRAGETPLQAARKSLEFDEKHMNGKRRQELEELIAVLSGRKAVTARSKSKSRWAPRLSIYSLSTVGTE